MKSVSDQELEQVAKEYQEDGYQVTIHPKGESLPSFAMGYEVDMIASNGGENAIVAVVANRSAFAARPYLLRLAELANSQPKWRFDLVVLGSQSLIERIANESGERSEKQIEELLERAERMAHTGDMDAACVYAWASLEAVMRRTAQDLDLGGQSLPIELLTKLYSNGIFSIDEYSELRKVFTLRTRVVHGFPSTSIDPSIIQFTVNTAKKLMHSEDVRIPSAAV
jgi:uncharacterized protein YutE (UPF0331/DUF86 family)